MNFWEKLARKKKPFFALAPMADVTDAAFRQIVAKYRKSHLDVGHPSAGHNGPDVFWTEMVSCDGLCSIGKKKVLPLLKYSEKERPIVAQVFGSKPENFYKTVKLIKKLGFDGIDINMGCPDKTINKQGAGSALIHTPELAKKIIEETKRGAGKMPVSVKTRIGYSQNELETWLPVLLSAKPAVITIHGRTKKEMSKVPAHWDAIKRAVELAKNSGTLIIGNGDMKDIPDGLEKAKESGVDGVMIGRAILGNPWLFKNLGTRQLSIGERLKVVVEHAKLFEKIYKGSRSFLLMRKHLGVYISGFAGAKELRAELMLAKNAKDIEKVVKGFLA